MAKPVIIIAPGSFSPASEYDSLISTLGSSGYEAFAYDLPTTRKKPGNPNETASTLAEDAMFFNGVCAALCDQSQNVVILGHSYGGMVISDAVKGLTTKRVGKGRVLGMVYLTAAALKEGQSLSEVTADADFSFIGMDGDYMYMADLDKSASINFSDLPLEKGKKYAEKFVYHSAPSFGGKLQYAGYKDVDNVAYVFCTEDKTLVPEFQQKCIDTIDEARKEAGKGQTKVYKLEGSSHCPTASRVTDLSRAVVEAVGEFER